MIGFCTVERPGSGSADFRIAKSIDARDVRQARQACYGMDSCGTGTVSAVDPAYLNSTSSKNIHYAIFDQPDFIQCSLVSDSAQHLGDLEILLRGPGGDPQTAATFTLPTGYTGTPYSVGGRTGVTSFYIYTGDKGAVNAGQTTRWYIDVSANQGSSTLLADMATATASNGPGIPYGIACTSGNGTTVPWLGTTGPANP